MLKPNLSGTYCPQCWEWEITVVFAVADHPSSRNDATPQQRELR